MRVFTLTPGIDSMLSYLYCKKKASKEDVLVYIPISQVYSKIEQYTLEDKFCSMKDVLSHRLVVLPFDNSHIYEDENGFIPGRNNLIVDLIQASFGTRPLQIVMGFTSDDRVYDSGPEWMIKTGKVLSEGVTLVSPFLSCNCSKKQAVDDFMVYSEEIPLDIKYEILKNSFSCYHPVMGQHCGECKACQRRATVLYPYFRMQLTDKGMEGLIKTSEDPGITESRRKAIQAYLNNETYAEIIK